LPALAALAATWTYYLNLCTYIRENSFAFESFKNEITVCGAKPLYHRLQTYLSILNLKFKKLNCSLWLRTNAALRATYFRKVALFYRFLPIHDCKCIFKISLGDTRSFPAFCQFCRTSASSFARKARSRSPASLLSHLRIRGQQLKQGGSRIRNL
jgi:hypothetical protein